MSAECIVRLGEEIKTLQSERDKLAAFKSWVHSYLDVHGVPHHPPGTHGAEGCRIGDRLDWVFAQLEHAKARTLTCCFCAAPCESIAALRVHSEACPAHPAVQALQLTRLEGGGE